MEINSIKEMKQALIDNGLEIKSTSMKGQYKVINKNLNVWQTVRFTNQTNISPAYIKVLKNNDWGETYFSNYILDSFLELIK